MVDKDFPNWNCADFDDGYEGPEYPDYSILSFVIVPRKGESDDNYL